MLFSCTLSFRPFLLVCGGWWLMLLTLPPVVDVTYITTSIIQAVQCKFVVITPES
jgi:uncharacterized protein (DUF608 family)